MLNKQQTAETLATIQEMFPNPNCELNHSTPFELLIAVVLSAQCTDELVNRVTPSLFAKYPSLDDYRAATLPELEAAIRQIGLFRNKAKFIKQLAEMLATEYGGVVPNKVEELMKLPGVGRKTANVVVSVAFGEPAIAVDTHVERVSKRLGICKQKATVLEVEQTLMRKVPKEKWSETHHLLIFFGRYHCKAQRPQCEICPLIEQCSEGKRRMQVKK